MMKYKNINGILMGLSVSFVSLVGVILPIILGEGNVYAIALAIFFGIHVVLGLVFAIKELITSYNIDEKEIVKQVFGITTRQISKYEIKDIILVKTIRTESLWCTVHVMPKTICDDIIFRAKSKITVWGKNTFLSKQKNVISIHLTIKAMFLMEKYGYYVKTTI